MGGCGKSDTLEQVVVAGAGADVATIATEVPLGGLGTPESISQGHARPELVVGFLPVTCHLTCPVTNWITSHSDKGSVFRSKKYTDFATVAEEFKSGKLKASFILAPLAMTLRRQGLPIKIVHLGHRDGTTMIVGKDSPYKSLADMKGKKIAIPHNYSNQRILLAREIERLGLQLSDFTLVPVPPPSTLRCYKKDRSTVTSLANPKRRKRRWTDSVGSSSSRRTSGRTSSRAFFAFRRISSRRTEPP